MELSSDDSLPSTGLEETSDHKENYENDSSKINPQPEVHNNSGDQDVNHVSSIPPPLPPKHHQRSPAFEKPLSSPLNTVNKENKALSSLACQMSPVLSGVKGNNRHLDRVPGEVPDMPNSYAYGMLPKVEPKCPPQLPPRPPPQSHIKPPRHKNPKKDEADEGNRADWRKHTGKTGDKRNREEQELTERHEKTEENEETSGIEGKPPRQSLGLFGEDRGKEDEGPSDIVVTTPVMTEDYSLPATERLDPIPAEGPGMAATNRNCTSTVSAEAEQMIPPQPPPKPPQTCPPKPPVKPPQLLSAIRAGIEEEKERRKQADEQWRDKDLVVKESEGDPRDTEWTSPTVTDMPSPLQTVVKSTVNQEVELPKGGEMLCLEPLSTNTPMAAELCEPQQHQSRANGHVQPGPLPRGTDSHMETLKGTEKNKEIHMSGQRGQEAEGPSGHRAGTEAGPCPLQRLEDAQGNAERLLDGDPKQTNRKTNARGKAKELAKKVMGRLKDKREEKRQIKVEEMEMGGGRRDDVESTQDEWRHGEEGGMEEDEEGTEEDAANQSAGTERQGHSELMGRTIRRRNATSESPFSSFKVCSPVRLVEELLSGDEWSQFLYREQSSTAAPPPHRTAQLSVDPRAEPDVFEGSPAGDRSNIVSEKSQTREQQELNGAPITAVPHLLLDSETGQMSPRTKDIYDTVEIIPPVQPANTYVNVSDVKSDRVLDSSVQKYLIRLSKKRRRRAARKQLRDRSHEALGQSPSSTSPQQIFAASVFYNVPARGGEADQQLESGGSSPQIKTALKDKTLLRAAQPEDGRGK